VIHRDAIAIALRAQLLDDRWSADELLVIDHVMNGLKRGREIYGSLNVLQDRRDFGDEARQEWRDALIYVAAHEIATNLHRRQRVLASETNGATPATTPPLSGPASRISPVVRSTPAKDRPEGRGLPVTTARRATQPSTPGTFHGHQDRNFFDGEDLAVPLEPPPRVERIPQKRFDTSDVPTVLIDFEMLDGEDS
jgi:hypothetical protein